MFESIHQRTQGHSEFALAKTLYSLLPVPLLIVNAQLQLIFSNEKAITLLGIQKQDPYDLHEEHTTIKRFKDALKKKLACFILLNLL